MITMAGDYKIVVLVISTFVQNRAPRPLESGWCLNSKEGADREIMRHNKRTGMDALNMDIWKMVMLFVAQSHDGARSLARARSACKRFKEAAEDKQVLQSVDFQNRSIFLYPISFWNTNGLFNKCMQAGNVSALDVTLKHITTRLIVLRQKRILANRAMEYSVQADLAHQTVNTRARKRNAELFKKEVRERANDIVKDRKEIREMRLMYRTSNFL